MNAVDNRNVLCWTQSRFKLKLWFGQGLNNREMSSYNAALRILPENNSPVAQDRKT